MTAARLGAAAPLPDAAAGAAPALAAARLAAAPDAAAGAAPALAAIRLAAASDVPAGAPPAPAAARLAAAPLPDVPAGAAPALTAARPARRVLLVDAFDSFVYIVAQYLRTAGTRAIVARPHELRGGRVLALRPDLIVLGPGPGHPLDSGHVELVRGLADRIPVFGICLGHQAIAVAYGATVRPARRPMHGKTSPIRHDGRGVFAGQPSPFRATRYHSLIVVEATIPDCLEVSARSADDGYVMGLRHRELPVESVQFHPESIRTEQGLRLIRNLVAGLEAVPDGLARPCALSPGGADRSR